MIKAISFFALLVSTAVICSFTYTSSTSTIENHSSATKGIEFKDMTFEEAKAKAKKTGKLIFIDAYASWCGPCKMMDRNTFSDEGIGKVFNDKFINLKIDMEIHADGPVISRLYKVTAYPTFLWIDGDGNIVKREMGYRSPEQFLSLISDLK
jgi:thioredoxin 1